jgi:GT2 family glycosyltransferase
MVRVSVVILNWNGINYIGKCIDSVIGQSYKDLEVIIIDNASTDRSPQLIRDNYSQFKCIINDKNLGFSKGMNQGIELCSGEFILLLNNDVYLDSNYIENGIKRMLVDEKIGFIGGLEYAWINGELTDKIHISCGPLYLRKRIQIVSKSNIYDEQFCFGITGSFPIVRRKMLEDVYSVSGSFFDDDFETGWEDTDMRFRAFLRGWKTLYYPKIRAWHILSASDGGRIRLTQKSSQYQVRILRNRYFVIIKNIPDDTKKWLRYSLFFSEIAIFIYYILLYQRTFISLVKAKKEVKRYSEKLIIKRDMIQSNILIDLSQLRKMFIEF